MDGPSVGDRLKKIKERVEEACLACGRDPGSVNVLAVAKLQPLTSIRAAYESGQRDFAENYVQEALDKMEQLYSLPVHWHFIGRIQSNKVKLLADGRFRIIHSVDRAPVAEQLNRLNAGARQDVFMQFNVAGEASKAGAAENEIGGLVRFVAESCPNLRTLGLMVMPPLGLGGRAYFRRAREVLENLRMGMSAQQIALHPLDQLSMGTSADFEDAIKEGATWIRIGTEIFGPREEKK